VAAFGGGLIPFNYIFSSINRHDFLERFSSYLNLKRVKVSLHILYLHEI